MKSFAPRRTAAVETARRGTIVSGLCAGILACAGFSSLESAAQNYPDKPIRMLVGYVAGGAADVTARLVAQKFSEHFGHPVIVENRPGAGGMIADERVAKSPPDGYTLLVVTTGATLVPALHAKLPYDVERDLAPVSLLTIVPFLLVVHPSVPARTVKQLIALAQSQPGKLGYGSAGIGSSAHLAGELFNLLAKVKTVHVPYKGGAESVIATAAGQIEMNYPSITAARPLLETRKLTVLAVTTTRRVSSMPSIPTLDESGLRAYEYFAWYGLLAPAGVPKDIIAKLNAASTAAVNSPEMKESFVKQGLEPRSNSPEEFGAFIHEQIVKNAKLVRLAGVKAE